MELNDNIEKDQKTYDDLSKKITELDLKIDKTDEEIKNFEKNNPDLVKSIKEEEKKNLDDEEFNTISGINLAKNEKTTEEKKEENKDDKLLNEDNNINNDNESEKIESQEKDKQSKKGKKDNNVNKKFVKKKTKKFGK